MVLVSFYISKWKKQPRIWGKPISISIEPTTACNLRCPECPSGLRSFTRATGNLKKDFYQETLSQISLTTISLTLYFQGEPFIHPSFLGMVKLASEQNIYTITSTNGHFLSDRVAKETVLSGLDRLIISVDGATQEVYEQYRVGGNLKEVLEGARRLMGWKRQMKSPTPYVVFQCLVVKPNQHQTSALHRLAQEIGVDEVKFKTVQVYDYKNGHPLIPDQPRFARYIESVDGTYQLKHTLRNECWKMWHSAVITWNGKVVPCCFDKDAQHILGDLRQDTMDVVWNSKEYESFRQAVFQDRGSIDICTNCTEGCKVWVET